MASKRSILRKVMVGAMEKPSWFEGTFGTTTTTTTTTTDITPTSTPTLESVVTAPAETTPPPTTWPDTTTTTTDTTTTDTTTITADANMRKAELVAIAEAAGHDVTGMTKTQILDLLQG